MRSDATAWCFEAGDNRISCVRAEAFLPEHAARTTYLACFHTARGYVFERSGQAAKTHRGVQSEFYRLSKDDERVDPDLRAFLSRAYVYKATADYETGPEDTTTPEDAGAAIETARRFVVGFARLTPLPGSVE